MLLLSKFFLDETCFQVLFLSASTFLLCVFCGLYGVCIFFLLLETAVQKQETAFFARGLIVQEMRRQVMKLRVEGSVS